MAKARGSDSGAFALLDMPVLQQPEMYIGRSGEKFDGAGKLTDPDAGAPLDAIAPRRTDC